MSVYLALNFIIGPLITRFPLSFFLFETNANLLLSTRCARVRTHLTALNSIEYEVLIFFRLPIVRLWLLCTEQMILQCIYAQLASIGIFKSPFKVIEINVQRKLMNWKQSMDSKLSMDARSKRYAIFFLYLIKGWWNWMEFGMKCVGKCPEHKVT